MKKIMLALALLLTVGISAKTIATVNGYPIDDKDANAFLKVVTKGKVTYKQLKKKDQVALVERLAVDKLVLKTAFKEINKKEQENIIAGFWLRKRAAKFKISDKEVKKAYAQNKQYFKDKKNKIIPFPKVKEVIRNSLAQKKAVAKMMEKAKIVMNGKVLKMPKASKKKKSAATSGKHGIYVVKSGNTLSGIASKYNISTKALRKMNHMNEKTVIKIGQKIKVPVK